MGLNNVGRSLQATPQPSPSDQEPKPAGDFIDSHIEGMLRKSVKYLQHVQTQLEDNPKVLGSRELSVIRKALKWEVFMTQHPDPSVRTAFLRSNDGKMCSKTLKDIMGTHGKEVSTGVLTRAVNVLKSAINHVNNKEFKGKKGKELKGQMQNSIKSIMEEIAIMIQSPLATNEFLDQFHQSKLGEEFQRCLVSLREIAQDLLPPAARK
jgi:C4-type Zn-finger protein